MSRENVIDRRGCAKLVLQFDPVWLENLKHHVVLKVLDEIEHSLKEGKRTAIPERNRERERERERERGIGRVE